jgi:hypothetical protein
MSMSSLCMGRVRTLIRTSLFASATLALELHASVSVAACYETVQVEHDTVNGASYVSSAAIRGEGLRDSRARIAI